MSRRQSRECASDLQLDRWLVGELAAGELAAVRAHVAGCVPCRDRREALEHEYCALAEQLPPVASLRQPDAPGAAQLPASQRAARVPPRSWAQPRLWAVLGSLAAALVVWVVALERVSPEGESNKVPPTESLTRTKGGATVQLDWMIRRGSTVLSLSPSEALQPGDALRFSVRASRPGYAAVLSLDGPRETSVYHDWVPVAAGVQLLPGAVELDDVLGDEHLYGVVCERMVPLPALEAAVRREPDKPELPSGCVVDLHVVRKERP